MVNAKMRVAGAAALAAATLFAMTGCAANQGGAQGSSQTLVIDRTFDLKSADPARSYEHTGNMLSHALYDTLLTFEGSDVTKPVASLAEVKPNDANTEFDVTLKSGRHFSDGSEVTADDVLFSFNRVKGVAGSPAFLLDGVDVAKTDATHLKITTKKPMPQLPYLLPNPSLAILNSKVVQQNGGLPAAADTAEKFLNENSAGSGPYKLEKLDLQSQFVLVKNDKYDGPKKPGYDRVVVRNVATATQLVNVKGGDSQMALDLTGDQVKDLPSNLKVTTVASTNMIFLLLNQSPEVNKFTANPEFVKAVKSAVEAPGLLEVAGTGSTVSAGVIPAAFVGGLKASEAAKHDAAAAAASLKASGYNGETIKLNYPNDVTLNGVDFNSLAQRVQAQLKAAGINVELAPAPVATELDAYRGGKEQIGLWYWGADYPDPSDYLVFGPGGLVGKRANYLENSDATVKAAMDKAAVATGDARAAAYQDFQKALAASGPFVPLLQPAVNIANDAKVSGVDVNPVWEIDVAELKPAS